MPIDSFQVKNSKILLNLNDGNFVAQQVQLVITATMDSVGTLITNSGAILVINFDASKAPWLKETPIVPGIIPCLKSPAADLWYYAFPMAQDRNIDSLNILLNCPSLQGVFQTSIDKKILTMKLNSNFPVQPPPAIHSCNLKLTNQNGVTSEFT